MPFSTPKGTFDLLPFFSKEEEQWKVISYWHYLEETIRELAREFSFEEIRTPIFESTELFARSVGEETDIVGKEMYTFEDKGGRSLTLRPEGTAAVMRSVIERRLYENPISHKLFYICPMFRHERPQAGRYRQHHQLGAEAIGSKSPRQDVEMIDMLWQLFSRLGLKNLQLIINSVGDSESREKYKHALCDYLSPHRDALSKESQNRLEKNPLRILDSKNPDDQKLIEKAPNILEFLSDETKEHFEEVQSLLTSLGISFSVVPTLVRGLDYYEKTVFEITSGELGAQNTVGAGGRYDSLVRLLGGPDLPAVGFATGLERILQTMLSQNAPLPKRTGPFLYLIPIGDKAMNYSFILAHQLREMHIPTDVMKEQKKIKAGLHFATEIDASYVAFLGDEELDNQEIVLKELQTRQEEKVVLSDFPTHIANLYGK